MNSFLVPQREKSQMGGDSEQSPPHPCSHKGVAYNLPYWLRFISEQFPPPISLVSALLLPNKLGTFALCPSEVMCFLLIFKINRYFRVITNNPETCSE